jgi:hypothetical protein
LSLPQRKPRAATALTVVDMMEKNMHAEITTAADCRVRS